MDFSSSEEALAHISEVARALVLHHNVHPSEISKAISERLREEANSLPKLEVLYNATYGGFEYSEEFEKYLPVSESTQCHKLLKMPPHMPPYMTAGPEDRVNDCGYIRPFGKQQANNFPVAFQTVLAYYDYKMEGRARDMRTVAWGKATSDATSDEMQSRQSARKACYDLPEKLVQSYCSHVAQKRKTKSWQNEESDDDFHQTIQRLGEQDDKIGRLSVSLIKTSCYACTSGFAQAITYHTMRTTQKLPPRHLG